MFEDKLIQKILEEKTKEEIMEYFCNKVKEETKMENIVEAWRNYKNDHNISIDV